MLLLGSGRLSLCLVIIGVAHGYFLNAGTPKVGYYMLPLGVVRKDICLLMSFMLNLIL